MIRSTALHRTGTILFMSYDLLDGTNAWPHYYRHDLESLFYILIWVGIHYDLKKKRQHRSHINGGKILPELTEWMGKYKRPCFQQLQETKSPGALDQILSQSSSFGSNLFGMSSMERMVAGQQSMTILNTMLLVTEEQHSKLSWPR
jgi:hypothetical protein